MVEDAWSLDCYHETMMKWKTQFISLYYHFTAGAFSFGGWAGLCLRQNFEYCRDDAELPYDKACQRLCTNLGTHRAYMCISV